MTQQTQLSFLPDVLPDENPFAFRTVSRLRNDFKRRRRRGAGRRRPFSFVHTYRVFWTAFRAFAMARQDPVPCWRKQGRMLAPVVWGCRRGCKSTVSDPRGSVLARSCHRSLSPPFSPQP